MPRIFKAPRADIFKMDKTATPQERREKVYRARQYRRWFKNEIEGWKRTLERYDTKSKLSEDQADQRKEIIHDLPLMQECLFQIDQGIKRMESFNPVTAIRGY